MEKEALAASRIRRLPPAVASLIAAGEVIERPASVLKELLENSLDAGASRIRVEAQAAGRKLLRVSDDGSGMGPEDCRLAFERHATSKIRSLEDLGRLSSFGFRGEALFAIAAVSRCSITSTPRSGSVGWTVQVEGGKTRADREAPPAPGTVVEVKDLFFNTPARAKFLKSDPSEKSHLTRVVEEAALANPQTAFQYKSDKRGVLDLAACGGPVQSRALGRVRDVLGAGLCDGLLSVAESRPGLSLRAYASAPDRLNPTRHFQFWFLNRRPISSRLLQQALYRAYEPFRSGERHPAGVFFLEMPADRFDVNVHPAKREVRFRHERELYEAIAGALSAVLLKSKGIPALARAPRAAPAETREVVAAYQISGAGASAVGEAPLELGLEAPTPAEAPRWYTPPFRFLGQIEQAYLVFEAAGGILLVDQHAAQERILFERYQAELESGAPGQRLMLPVSIELPASQVQSILARSERLRRAGFELEPFGKTTLQVTAAPAAFAKAADLREMVHRLLDHLQSVPEAASSVRQEALATIACKAAVKAHDRLGAAEAAALLEDLRDCRDGSACPHGRPSMISLSRDELARRFKRPGPPPL